MRCWSPGAAFAQKQGGVLKVYHWDSPASMSIHEEATVAAEGPMMDVFNNLVMYPWSSWQRQGRRLIWIELHVESNEKCCCPSIIAHESDEIDQRALAELP